jgi:ubiquinone/menaquinone biosynthesis C-methylase UbiE
MTIENYLNMQRRSYSSSYSHWSIADRDHAVGCFDAHNAWPVYETLWRDVDPVRHRTCLDFGCGPGRNIVRWGDRFDRMDGTDLDEQALAKARVWIGHNNKPQEKSDFFPCSGRDLSNIPSDKYDVVMSTIVLQHICVHSIRFSLFQEMYRVLKPNGILTVQMGYGGKPNGVWRFWKDDYTQAEATNGVMDVSIIDPREVSEDLTKIGFHNFRHYITPVGPCDYHANWIFFNATKP